MAKTVVINDVIYQDVPYIKVPLSGTTGDALFYDISDATGVAGDLLSGKSTYGQNGKINGSMANNGDTSGTISTKNGTVTIPSGYTTGGTVSISSAEVQKIIADNIRGGVTILGQAGSNMVVNTTISSGGASASDILNGKKGYVNGALVDGTLSVPTVSQDSTTKVLTIS